MRESLVVEGGSLGAGYFFSTLIEGGECGMLIGEGGVVYSGLQKSPIRPNSQQIVLWSQLTGNTTLQFQNTLT